jgi:hypothetical protein
MIWPYFGLIGITGGGVEAFVAEALTEPPVV